MRIKEYNNGYISGKDIILEECDILELEKSNIKLFYNVELSDDLNLSQVNNIKYGLKKGLSMDLIKKANYNNRIINELVYFKDKNIDRLKDEILYHNNLLHSFEELKIILEYNDFKKNNKLNGWIIKKINKIAKKDIISYFNNNKKIEIELLNNDNIFSTLKYIVLHKKNYDTITINDLLNYINNKHNYINECVKILDYTLQILSNN